MSSMPSAGPIVFYSRRTEDPATLEWVVEPGLIRFTWEGGAGDGAGLVERGALPPRIARYLEEGLLSRLRLQPGRIYTTLAPGGDWAEIARPLWSDLYRTLTEDPAGWPTGDLPVASPTAASDAELAQAVEELIAREAGAFAATHGGSMALESVHDGVVRVHMSGACRNCPAAQRTLLQQIELQLRHRFTNLREIIPV